MFKLLKFIHGATNFLSHFPFLLLLQLFSLFPLHSAMASFLLTSTTSLLGGSSSQLSSLLSSSSSLSSILSSKVKVNRRSRIEKVSPLSIVASDDQSKRGNDIKRNVVADKTPGTVPAVGSVPEVSWKDLKYPAGSVGNRLPKPTNIDREKQITYLTKILNSKVYDVAVETPLQLAPLLSAELGVNLWIKRDDAQQIFSFKIRGAYNKIAHLSQTEKNNGVICASAGNHAQGVALAGRRLGVTSYIVMPVTTPEIKINAVTRLGGKVDLHGNTFNEAMIRAKERAKEENLTYVPSDVEDSIAGQGSVGMEIARQLRGDIHAIFVPIGGGGLICGIASYYKMIHPEVKIYGVQPTDSNAMAQAICRGKIVNVTDVGNFAEGVAIQQVGEESFRICNELVDDVILVDKKAISVSIKDMFNDGRNILEPSGALAITAAKAYCEYQNKNNNRISGVNIVAVTTGANMNFDELREIVEYAKDDQAVLTTILPDQSGSLKASIDLVDSNITGMTYRYEDSTKEDIVVYSVKAVGKELEDLIELLNSKGFQTTLFSDNPVVTNHLRYMTGGRSRVENEILFRFTFPEKAGALKHYLKDFHPNWKITLLHSRQEGIITSDVLIGIQMDKSEEKNFHAHAKKVGYLYEQVAADDAAYSLARLV